MQLAALRPDRSAPAPRPRPSATEALSAAEHRVALALARALLPAGRVFEGADGRTLDALVELLSQFGKGAVRQYAKLLHALEQGARASAGGRAFSALSLPEAQRVLAAWSESDGVAVRTLAFMLATPLKVAHFDDPRVYAALGGTHRFVTPSPPRDPFEGARWASQVTRGDEVAEDLDLECDVVVVGTGAGGAVVAKELATKGHAVLLLEEGGYHSRHDFHGSAIESFVRFYRGKGLTGSIGNTVIALPMGRLVGGSTAVNTGTCWRTPEWVLERWAREEGLADLAPGRMEPYFDRVERELDVQVVDARFLGGAARVIARGCDALGYAHGPLRRNAPGCDGAGVCDSGCPTGARRSMDITYVPAALRSGAALYTGARAERITVEGGRVVGLEARTASGKRLRVRARATVLSCGALVTPAFLLRQGLGRGLRHLGRNLSVHPASIVSALFDERIAGYAAIPQGYGIEEFRHEGILLMGASAPIDLAASQFAFVGDRLVETMEAYDRIASFGLMVEDRSVGRVRLGPGGRPLVSYWLGAREEQMLRRAVEILSRIFLAAGASEVYPAIHGHRVLRSAADLARLRETRTSAADWILTGFHPLGTCRMAISPSRGVVSPDHQVHGLPGLYVVDGSSVPSAVGVNPQITIMALATRAANRLAEELERTSG